ncbi:hypothetical protein JOD64_001335 [Micromonospora luteifusca]|uniref:Uncharacterized protein n=1 Tax=Micromonospora luteifusca TaxID=709860 RepID=A0ABS2LPK9_9ACTN|nr:hypothetical protein [Micromonospora luteifusca]MBM7490113.1 hypothetical protein [Micromonospora luteifusca]
MLLLVLILGLASGYAAGVLLPIFTPAWIQHQVWSFLARCWFSASGRLPWRITRFLDDAYRRGVLRRVGAEYQFRHDRLKQHLSAIDE